VITHEITVTNQSGNVCRTGCFQFSTRMGMPAVVMAMTLATRLTTPLHVIETIAAMAAAMASTVSFLVHCHLPRARRARETDAAPRTHPRGSQIGLPVRNVFTSRSTSRTVHMQKLARPVEGALRNQTWSAYLKRKTAEGTPPQNARLVRSIDRLILKEHLPFLVK